MVKLKKGSDKYVHAESHLLPDLHIKEINKIAFLLWDIIPRLLLDPPPRDLVSLLYDTR